MWPWQSPRSREEELDRELRAHLDLETEERQTQGLPADDARYAALRAFGNVAFVREETRSVWTATTIEQIAQDLRPGGQIYTAMGRR